MENRRILVVFGLILSSLCSSFLIADDVITALIKKMDVFSTAHPQEKVHLHLDKAAYRAGENVWFRAYVINPADSKLSHLSGVLNVDLISSKDSLLETRKIQLTNGMGSGDFKLADTLNQGFYRIRAYTQLMRNLGPEFFFDQLLQVDHPSGKQVYASTTYTYLNDKSTEQVQAKLKFIDEQGRPYASRDVSYQLTIGSKTILHGRDKTNVAGTLNIIWNTPVGSPRTGGRISASIQIADAVQVNKEIPIKALADSSLVQFFPEGGQLLEGLTNKIAFKAINASGLPEEIKGVLVDNTGKTLKAFQSSYAGIGSFVFKPLSGTTYKAKLTFTDGSTSILPLPTVGKSGHVLALDNRDTTDLQMEVRTSQASIGKEELHVVVQHSGNILLIFKVVPKDTVLSIRIPVNKLPSGIIQLTLFSAKLEPISERLIFNDRKADQLPLQIKTDQDAYEPRSLVHLDLQSTKREKAYFSIAVTHATQADPENESTIQTTLLLNSDLSGYVQNSGRYFSDTTSKTKQDLDNLLLTQRGSRFLWKDVLADKISKPPFSAEKNFRISGKVLSLTGKPVPKARVSLFAPETGSFAIDTLADANGNFNFDQLVYADGTKFIVQAANAKGKLDVRLQLDPGAEQVITPHKNPARLELNARETIASYLGRANQEPLQTPTAGVNPNAIALKEVKIKGQRKSPISHSANLNGAGVADQVIVGIDMGTCINLAECLKGRVVGYTLRNDTPFLARSPFLPMMLSLDGVLVDGSRLRDVNPSDIETIEILKTPINTSIYGSRGIGGVIVINTKRQVSGRSIVYAKPWIVSHQPFGFTASRPFPAIQNTTSDSPPTDSWKTVYWKPDVVTGADGKATLSFYTSDQPGTYRVVVEGINQQGQIGRVVYNFTVQSKK